MDGRRRMQVFDGVAAAFYLLEEDWHVYQWWNKRLFMEMYAAYKAGRADPFEGWFGESFDNYVRPTV
jgi:hypothetical protein